MKRVLFIALVFSTVIGCSHEANDENRSDIGSDSARNASDVAGADVDARPEPDLGADARPEPDLGADMPEPYAGGPISLGDFTTFTRHGAPILRDPIENVEYEVASDAHVFRDEAGELRMVYTGDVDDRGGPKLATGDGYDSWSIDAALLKDVGPSGADAYKETPFYRRAADGTHELYYIGYTDEEVYDSQIFVATAEELAGPYTQAAAPLIPRGELAGRQVELITSPSVVEHEGQLYMVWLSWNGSPETVTAVWPMAATSNDDGETWGDIEVVDVPIGMEGQLTKGPDGAFYAVRQNAEDGRPQEIVLSRAEHPLGPYESLTEPVLVQAGEPWEADELNAPQLTFDTPSRTAYLYYVGADYERGWWVMMAYAQF